MMDDQERSMNATDVDADETVARAALAAHPWPRFGQALQAKLMAIPTAADAPSPDRGVGPLPLTTPSAARPATIRDTRLWRREAWATAAVLATVAALALAAVGTARLRQARPVERPVGESVTPEAEMTSVATVTTLDAMTDVLTGRLIYIEPGQGESSETVFALNMRTGKSDRLWDVPGTDTIGQRAVSPDGTRLAYARGKGESPKAQISVRHLVADAPEPAILADPAQVDGLIWSRDSSALYYSELLWQPSFESADATVAGWELHRLDLDDRRLDGERTTALDGPPSWGIDAGEDRVVARLDAAAIGDENFAVLLAVDSANQRAAVGIGLGENGWMDAIALLDISTGVELERVPAGRIEGFNWAPNRNGTKLAYTNCLGCYEGDEPYRVRVLTLATGEVTDIWSDRDGPLESAPLLWSPDDRWVQWTVDGGETTIVEVDGTAARAEDVPARLGFTVDFAPSGKQLLMSTGQLIDLTTRTSAGRHAQPLPWTLPSWLGEWNSYLGQFVAWVPDIEAGSAAAQAPTPVTATSSDPVGTLLASAVVLTPVATVAAAEGQHAGVTILEPWSPDGRWLPYWMSSGYVALPGVEQAQLGFLDARSDTPCVQAGIQRRSHADRIFWQPDGRVVVRVDGVPSIGQPCGVLSPLPDSPLALPTARPAETPAWAVPLGRGQQMGANESRVIEGYPVEDRSPDGLWLATTAPIDGTPWSFRERPRRYITTITSVADGRRVVDKMWERAEETEDWNPAMAGTWLPSGAYLIFRTADHGPLLFTTDGTVQPAGEALFGVPMPPGDPSSRRVRVQWAADGEDWHAVLEGYGHLRLYHPEVPVVEELPHDIFVGADAGPLLVIGDDAGPNHSPDPSGRWYVRQLDAIDTPFTAVDAEHASLTMGTRSVAIAPDGQTVALHDMARELVTLHPFADLDANLGRWRLDGYKVSELKWSPDGRTLVIEGHVDLTPGDPDGRALFLVHPPSAP